MCLGEGGAGGLGGWGEEIRYTKSMKQHPLVSSWTSSTKSIKKGKKIYVFSEACGTRFHLKSTLEKIL